ncbi:hypothetical protein [Corynebacterium sp. NML140438]|uniref:hypothetical protein n=1 Tax=Corynebacterium sp. NML140438 TaxID=1906334 RepID=UPI0015A53A9F|nr:hypothetical protein [Corynebacterium sp. NML140438]
MDLAVIVDALKDFNTFASAIVKLFRAVPDVLLQFGGLGDKAKDFTGATQVPSKK